MIKFEHTEVLGWEPAIRGMRNPMNSWDMSDSGYCETHGPEHCADCEYVANWCNADDADIDTKYIIGPKDMDLIMRLRKGGSDDRKFMRMIVVYVDITAPLYWWKEFDTYKVGTVANSCSTMHKIHSKEFMVEDFSMEHLLTDSSDINVQTDCGDPYEDYEESPMSMMKYWVIGMLNAAREKFLETKDKKYWHQMIQLLPTSYNQKRTVMLNYEVLANIYHARKNHKLDEWSKGFIDWIWALPYSEIITGVKAEWKPAPEEVR